MITVDDNIVVETTYQGSNNAIVRTGDGLVLIDSPFRPTDAAAWRQIVGRYGAARYIISTDHHADHTFGNGFLPGEVIGHRETRKIMQEDRVRGPAKWLLDLLPVIDPEGFQKYVVEKAYRTRIPTITFTDAMTLSVGDVDFELFHAPGHTHNTICIYLPRQEVLFCGDAICEAGIPSFVDANIYDWLDTIEKIHALDIRYLVTGHGDICGPEIIKTFRQQIVDVIEEVERRIDLGQSREQISREVTYEDRIHTCVNGWTAFPDELVSWIIVRSIERVNDDIQENRRTQSGASAIRLSAQ